MDQVRRVAAIIVNYNMPERADALAEHILQSVWPVDLYLVDNGSDITEPARLTTVKVSKNVQTTGGWLAGLEAASRQGDYFAYWFLITSAEFVDDYEVLYPMAEWMATHDDAVGIHPALTQDSTTAWRHLISRGGDRPRKTWMIDNIASLYRADWFESIGRFDAKLTYGWGIDLETCYKARQADKSLWVDERVHIKKVTDIGYAMRRMNMGAQQRRYLASRNMNQVFLEKYGLDWRKKLMTVTADLV